MAIILFDKPNFTGESLRLDRDVPDLRHSVVGKSASSVRLTQAGDRALFFGKPDWRGQVMFRQGVREIAHLGRPKDGGKTGFGNDLVSARVTPLELPLHYHVVQDEDGSFPGSLANARAVEQYLRAVTRAASAIWEQGLLELTLDGFSQVSSPRLFNLRNEYLNLLTSRQFIIRKNMANIVLVNSIRDAKAGIAVPRCITKRIVVEFTGAIQTAGAIVAHEIGHFLGLLHDKNSANLMFPRVGGTQLNEEQIELAQHHLAQASGTRRGVRQS